jgi:hypothetical protein
MRSTIAAVIAGGVLLVAAALAQEERPARPAPADPSIYDYGDVEKTCRSWTDSCRTCTRGRTDEDALACSNVGIACQPKDIECTERVGAKAPAPIPPATETK